METTSNSSIVSSAYTGKSRLAASAVTPTANVAGERLQLFYRDKLNFPLSRDGRQRLQVQFLIAGDHRHNNSVALATRDQRLENLLRRQSDFGGNGFRGEVVGIDLVLTQLVVDSHLVEESRGICLLSLFHVYSVQSLDEGGLSCDFYCIGF